MTMTTSSSHQHAALARELNNIGFELAPGQSVVVPQLGGNLSKLQLYAHAAELDPTLAESWYNLGTQLSRGETIIVAGEAITETEAFRRSCELDSELAASFFNLGVSLRPPVRDVVVGDSTLTKKACYERAVTLDSSLGFCWFNLALQTKDDDVAVVGDELLSSLDCFVRALENDKSIAGAWTMAGRALCGIAPDDDALAEVDDIARRLQDSGSITVDEHEYCAAECFACSLALDPRLGSTWFLVALSLPDDVTAFTLAGERFDKRACLLESLERSATRASVHYELGKLLRRVPPSSPSSSSLSTAVVCGRPGVTALDCYVAAASLDDSRARYWFNCGVLCPSGKRLRIHDAMMSEKDLFTACINCESADADTRDSSIFAEAWFSLAAVMSDSDTASIVDHATLETTTITKAEAFAEAIRRDNAHTNAWRGLARALDDVDMGEHHRSSSKNNKENAVVLIDAELLDAKACLSRCIELNPSDPTAWRRLGRRLSLKRGDTAVVNGEEVSAHDAIQRAAASAAAAAAAAAAATGAASK